MLEPVVYIIDIITVCCLGQGWIKTLWGTWGHAKSMSFRKSCFFFSLSPSPHVTLCLVFNLTPSPLGDFLHGPLGPENYRQEKE